MKNISIILAFLVFMFMLIYGLYAISEQNECTSIRSFICDS